MRLTRLSYDIDCVLFGKKSCIEGHTLILDKLELERLIESSEFSSVKIGISAPGSGARILSVGDVTEPTIRIGAEDTTFPGLIGKTRTVGDGSSIVLRGVVISEVVEVTVEIPSVLQLSEEAAEVTALAGMWHVTVDAYPASGVAKYDYLRALNVASKRVAKYIASLAAALEPDEQEVLELKQGDLGGLPRVAYLANVFCHRPLTESLIYGASMQDALPIILHPNEILDGALTNRNYDNSFNADPTFVWQNHPIILELIRRHGVDLDFAGVVVSNVHHELACKERNAIMSAALLKHNLRADAVIITKEGGGHPQVDVGLQVDALEGGYGIKTVILIVEMLSMTNDSYGQLIFTSDFANAIVSTGCTTIVALPPATEEIGTVWSARAGMGEGDIGEAGELKVNYRVLRAGQSQLGWTHYGSLKF